MHATYSQLQHSHNTRHNEQHELLRQHRDVQGEYARLMDKYGRSLENSETAGDTGAIPSEDWTACGEEGSIERRELRTHVQYWVLAECEDKKGKMRRIRTNSKLHKDSKEIMI